MDLKWFKGKKVTVFGIGLLGGGVGTIRFLVENGAKVIATDIKDRKSLAPSLEQLKDLKNIEYILGQHRPEDFTRVDMIIKTPQVSWNNKYIKMALDKDIPVEVDSSLFFKLCKNPIIGITGTKGKTTTSQLIYHILNKSNKEPLKVGIGQTPVLNRLSLLKKNTVVVFELSSCRLSALTRAKISPKIAVFTSFFSDHLNYYHSIGEYLNDKKSIFKNQKSNDWFVCNVDDLTIKNFFEEAKGNILPASMNKTNYSKEIYFQDNFIYLNNGEENIKIIKKEEILLRGEHNIRNIMLAIGTCYLYGVSVKDIKEAIKSFLSITHRLEFVAEKKGIKYYNDASATNPQSAINSLKSFDEPIILIAGGADKNLDYKEFSEIINNKVKGVIFIKGEATNKIISNIKKIADFDEKKRFEIVDSMEKAVEIASRCACEGDVVLLSPGAEASKIFFNEFDQGNQFKYAVDKL